LDARKRFDEYLNRDFFPILRAEGFKGSAGRLHRFNGDAIHVIQVQGSSFGGQCCVNLAVHVAFLPTAGGGTMTEGRKLKEYECEFRLRLCEKNEWDHWWEYGDSDRAAAANVASLVDTYRRRGPLFFDRFTPFPDVFLKIDPSKLDVGKVSTFDAWISVPHMALTLARIMHHLGDRRKCRRFAEIGLRHTDSFATDLIQELEAMKRL
jgi:hypothetical protein